LVAILVFWLNASCERCRLATQQTMWERVYTSHAIRGFYWQMGRCSWQNFVCFASFLWILDWRSNAHVAACRIQPVTEASLLL